ncbi:hypothetical protein LZ012_01800 [Dechloromonas sp. XY25]|uniref:Ubiquinone biosynthesis accessory factor UbiJ n=1 Tax=Dechloromonas hankyongensis TaxID=2908002 RepID=A0ABS9JXT9_9RHOO|nr:hypothetical protein [Dechloromonas hankyongensis]MCG2575723.1 hypothetical protein [Dechloromonas hankyongensis]
MDAIKQVGVRGLNHLVRSESWAHERLLKHSGAHVRVDAGLFSLGLGIDQHGLFQLAAGERSPDVTLSLPPDFAVRALFDRSKLFATVKLDGSVDVAESLAFVFRNLRWDAEADLAGVIGDIAAHRLVRIGQSLASALSNSLRNTAANIQEYVVEESGILPSPRELGSFGEAVGRLRDDVASLEKRLAKL